MARLAATMPEVNLRALVADFLLRDVRLADRARREAPWGREPPESIFRQHELPHASANERRDDWRKALLDRFANEAWKFREPIDAVSSTKDRLPDILDVHFHAEKRKKPGRSPYESMELGWAICTGLSILVIDACRACGIRARMVGCLACKKAQGNRNWVEVTCGGELIARAKAGADGKAMLPLARGCQFDEVARRADGPARTVIVRP